MKTTSLRAWILLALAMLFLAVTAAPAGDTNPPPQLTVELRDGSRVVGTTAEKNLRFHSDLLGDFKLAVADIRSVEFARTNAAKLVTVNGDVLTIRLAANKLAVNTSFGEVKLAVDSLRKISVTASHSFLSHPAGLVAFWSGENEGRDSIGSLNAEVVGVDFVPEKFGKAFDFSGTSTSAVRIRNGGQLISAAYSIGTWVNPRSQVTDPIGQWLVFGQGYGAMQLVVRRGENGLRVALLFGHDHYNFFEAQSNSEIPIGKATHLAGTWDGRTLRVYIDGVLSATSTPEQTPVNSGCDLYIGGFNDPLPGDCQYVGQLFNGTIGGVSLYNRALSAEEIKSIAVE